jgi:hypothetical protein
LSIRAAWLGLHVLRVIIAMIVPVYALLAVIRRAEAGSTTRRQMEQHAP